MSAASEDLRADMGDLVTAAGPQDTVGGMPARWLARPATTAQTAQVLRSAAADDLAVVVRGSGTKLGWGARPERLDLIVDTSRMDAVVEHSAGDLVCVVQAGVPVARLQEQLMTAGQRLGIDPARPGSVGGAVATASTGPGRLHHGSVRDLVIGMTMVLADGTIAHSGGKVVKNVAGYDLGKLLSGSFGTLAVITEVAFRLHPIPPAQRWVSVGVDEAAAIQRIVQSVAHSQVFPSAVELDRGAGPGMLSVLLEGTSAGLEGRVERLRELLGPEASDSDQPPDWWGLEPPHEGGALLKVTHELARLDQLLAALDALAPAVGARATLRSSALVGTAYVGLQAGIDRDSLATFVSGLRDRAPSFGGSVVLLEATDDLAAGIDTWGPVNGLQLMRSVKQQFDPERRLAPGRFVGGI